jgi:hypothetical protein
MNIGSIVTVSITAFVVVIAGGMYGCPKYRVYSQTYSGEAALREAEWSKKVSIEEARAAEESATLKAQARVTQAKAEGEAELVRAKATAEANQILGQSLKDNEAYLRYLWIQGLQDGNGERIYIPTEAGLPILEAGKAGK